MTDSLNHPSTDIRPLCLNGYRSRPSSIHCECRGCHSVEITLPPPTSLQPTHCDPVWNHDTEQQTEYHHGLHSQVSIPSLSERKANRFFYSVPCSIPQSYQETDKQEALLAWAEKATETINRIYQDRIRAITKQYYEWNQQNYDMELRVLETISSMFENMMKLAEEEMEHGESSSLHDEVDDPVQQTLDARTVTCESRQNFEQPDCGNNAMTMKPTSATKGSSLPSQLLLETTSSQAKNVIRLTEEQSRSCTNPVLSSSPFKEGRERSQQTSIDNDVSSTSESAALLDNDSPVRECHVTPAATTLSATPRRKNAAAQPFPWTPREDMTHCQTEDNTEYSSTNQEFPKLRFNERTENVKCQYMSLVDRHDLRYKSIELNERTESKRRSKTEYLIATNANKVTKERSNFITAFGCVLYFGCRLHPKMNGSPLTSGVMESYRATKGYSKRGTFATSAEGNVPRSWSHSNERLTSWSHLSSCCHLKRLLREPSI